MSDGGFRALSRPCQVLPLGFSAFERKTLATVFRLAEQRAPAYVWCDDELDADLVLLDADQPEARSQLPRGWPVERILFVGRRAADGAHGWLPRPLDALRVLRELDLLLAQCADFEVDTVPAPLPRQALPLALMAPRPPEGLDRVTALVVDDSPIARRFLEARLIRMGYQVQTAGTGEDALERLSQQPFALIFLDTRLGTRPALDGLNLCQFVKQLCETQAWPVTPRVVLVSDSTSASDQVRAMLVGADACLSKPLHMPEFVATLRRLDPALPR
jgi:two-component system cell cycle response regulator